MTTISSFLIFTFLYVTTEELLIRNTSYQTNHLHRNRTKRLIFEDNIHFTNIRYLAGLVHNYELIGTGSIISDTFILTAAQCVCLYNNTNLRILLRNTLVLDMYENKRKYRDIEEIICHPRFNHTTYYYDVAIIKVKYKIRLHAPHRFVELFPSDQVRSLRSSIAGVGKIAGWVSADMEDEYIASYYSVTMVLPITPHDLCKRLIVYADYTVFCVGFNEMEFSPACFEDAGAPFLMNGLQYGIASKSLRCGSTKLPIIFTSLNSHYVRWFIKHHTDL